jgi:hypothetical protein
MSKTSPLQNASLHQQHYAHLIHQNVSSPLSSVAFHHDVSFIERFFADTFPLHLAIHHVSCDLANTHMYTEPHWHDVAELNVIIGAENELEYLIQLGEEEYQVKSNASIWVPAGVVHAANVIRGDGYFVALRLPDQTQWQQLLGHNWNQ